MSKDGMLTSNSAVKIAPTLVKKVPPRRDKLNILTYFLEEVLSSTIYSIEHVESSIR